MHRVIFALTAQGGSFFSAMTRIAVASIRLSNPHLAISVYCDAETDRALRSARDPLCHEVDDWQPQTTPPGSASFRNRFVKTRLRSTLDGPFLFLDSDVLVRDDLSALFTLDTDLAGARNHSLADYSEQIWTSDAATLQALGWIVRPDVYINGGVLLYQDTEGARRFAEDWHQRWLHCFEAHHNHRDQPALNAALQATRPRLQVLPDRFNAQFKCNPGALQNAVLWHYYASVIDGRPETLFELLIQDLMCGKPLDLGRVEQMIHAAHPWRAQTAFGDWAFKQILARNRFSGWEAAVLRQDAPRHFYRIVRNLARRTLKSKT